MKRKKLNNWGGHIAAWLLVLMMAVPGWADHDLYMDDAPDVTSSSPTLCKSPDIKIGADFGVTFPPDVVRRGVTNPIYVRFGINGTDDYAVPSGSVKVRLHYRPTTIIGETPPELTAPGAGWLHIGDLTVTYDPTVDGPFPFNIGKEWPTDFPSVTTKSVNWSAPLTGNDFHIRAEVMYTGSYEDDQDGDNVAISRYTSILGIRDVDMVIVHDMSGSMYYYTHNGDSYIKHAKDKAKMFIDLMKATHKVAVVAFSTDYTGGKEDVWPTPTASLQPVGPNRAAIKTAITGMSGSGWGGTPMGAGLERAIQIINAGSTDPQRKRTILLLSDGEENSGTRACPPSYPSGTCVGGTILSQLQTNKIRVFSIALGAYAWTQCLECLATQSDGQWYAPAGPGIDLAQVYLDMQQAYTADDLYRVDRGIGGGGDDTYEIFFEGLDDVLCFVLAWDDLGANFSLQLRAPGGQWTSPGAVAGATVSRGDGYLVVRVNKPRTGNWGYRVIEGSGKRYLAAVRSDRVGVRLDVDIQSSGVVGDAIVIKAHLADQGIPITDANLAATVQAPVKVSFDTRLRQAARDYIKKYKALPIDQSVLQENRDVSVRAAFIHKISDGNPDQLVATRPITVPLFHDGNGYYSGVLKGDQATIAGQYNVTVKCGEAKFHRNYSRPLKLQPATVDFEKSFAEIVKLKAKDKPAAYLLRTYPTDRFGNAVIEPSLLYQLKAKVSGADLDKEPAIAFDGTYQQELKVSAGQTPTLQKVQIGDQQVKIDTVKPKKHGWKYGIGGFLLLLLAILAL
jgi:hypothetical protein